MTGESICTLTALSENDLSALSGRIAPWLRLGDILFLDGPLGAGKTSFARSLIRHCIGDEALEVPSPTFSLAQCYETESMDRTPIWHFDLYRIEQGRELVELGLEDALDTGISLIEWPDRLHDYPGGFPVGYALTIRLEIADELMRNVTIIGDKEWQNRLPADLRGDLYGPDLSDIAR